MHIKPQTVIPSNVKITRCPTAVGQAKSVYSLLRAEEKRLEMENETKTKANKVTACLKAGFSVAEAIELCK